MGLRHYPRHQIEIFGIFRTVISSFFLYSRSPSHFLDLLFEFNAYVLKNYIIFYFQRRFFKIIPWVQSVSIQIYRYLKAWSLKRELMLRNGIREILHLFAGKYFVAKDKKKRTCIRWKAVPCISALHELNID
jgi:hypothetical protein